MASMRISGMKLFRFSVKSSALFDVRPPITFARVSSNAQRFNQTGFGMIRFSSAIFCQGMARFNCAKFSQYSRGYNYVLGFSNRILGNSGYGCSSPLINYRFFSSATDVKGVTPGDVTGDVAEIGAHGVSKTPGDVAEISAHGASISENSVSGDNWISVWQSAVEKANEAAKWVNEAALWVDANPSIVPVTVAGTLAVTMLTWPLVNTLFKRLHENSVEGRAALEPRRSIWPFPYEESFWGALEVPVRNLITFLAFLNIWTMVSPTTIVTQYATQAWKGAVVISVVWFLNRWTINLIVWKVFFISIALLLHRWKTDLLARDLAYKRSYEDVEMDALAKAFADGMRNVTGSGRGIGGASKDILVKDPSVQMSQPFSIGDTIKVGSVKGQVVKLGHTTTTLQTVEKIPVVVPNSLFASQVIVNKSRARFHSMVKKVYIRIDAIDKVPQILEDIKSMLRSNSNVFLRQSPPICFLSEVKRSSAELTFGCILNQVDKEVEQEILFKVGQIIKEHGANLN